MTALRLFLSWLLMLSAIPVLLVAWALLSVAVWLRPDPSVHL
jgi:hypothetical protein